MALWDRISSRGNVEDRRGFAPAIGGISVTGLAILLLFNYLSGGDITDVINQLPPPTQNVQVANPDQFEGEDQYEVFASTVLGSNNDLWRQLFVKQNQNYQEPTLVLFRIATQSACGNATSAVGPHYCPLDQTIYLDETFFDELTNRLGARGGDVAEAYVISHEVGHHAQNLLDLLNQNDSISTELQADCFAGLWANSIKDRQVLAPGEIEEAMDAASAVGDDRIQHKVQGQINPETWTHGSSEQRVNAFNTGYTQGTLESCIL